MRNILIALFMIVSTCAFAQVPTNTGRVTDTTNTLSYYEKSQLANKMLSKQQTAQLAVLFVDKIPNGDINDFKIDVARAWKLGKGNNIDDGLLLVIAVGDKKIAIEVGTGIQDRITDSRSRQIIDNMKPALKERKWAQAVDVFINESITLLTKEK